LEHHFQRLIKRSKPKSRPAVTARAQTKRVRRIGVLMGLVANALTPPPRGHNPE
jgi:hypothetical protein